MHRLSGKDIPLAESAVSPSGQSNGPINNRPNSKLGLRSLVTVVSTIVLVATEFIALGVAAGWAVAGLLELGNAFEYVLMTAFGLIGLWATVRFARGAWRLEAEHQHT